jgi:cysteine desulfurase
MATPIYMNHAATWPLDPRVAGVMRPLLDEDPRREGSLLADGRRLQRVIDEARARVSAFSGFPEEGIIFTSGGTEACNLAIKGVALSRLARGARGRIVVGATERAAVLHPALTMGKLGFEVAVAPVGRDGVIDRGRLEDLLPGALLLCVAAADEETGTLQPLEEVAEQARRHGVLLLVDACLAAGYLGGPWGGIDADLVSLSAHRMGGPRGAGALCVRRGVRLLPLVEGGTQEGGRRAGMPDVAALCGFGEAARLRAAQLPEDGPGMERRGRDLAARLLGQRGVLLNGHPEKRLQAMVNVSAAGVDGEALLLKLARSGVAASSGSSCAQEAGKPSRVLTAMGVEEALAQSSVLFSLGPSNSGEDVVRAAEAMERALEELRALAPRMDASRDGS